MYVRDEIGDKFLSKSHNAHIKGKSVDTGLHRVKVKEYTLAAFLDIEGAFNNVHKY